jgi:hypothetical protein
MKNWKTTALGLISAVASFVMFSPETFSRWPWVVTLAKFVTVGGLAGIGLAAKDSSTHSTVDEVTESTSKEKSAS